MGRELYATYPAFARTFDTVTQALDPHLTQHLPHHPTIPHHPLHTIILAPPHTPHAQLLNHTIYTQPALFTIEVALHHLLTTWGITPHLLTGHSLGEITAAHLAGTLTLHDAAHLITTRAHLMQTLPPGTMTAIQATQEEIQHSITQHNATTTATIAATNSPHNTVISGNPHTIQTLTHHWQQQNRKTTPLNTQHAYHSHHTNTILPTFHHTTQQLTYHPPHTPIISNQTGTTATTQQLTNPTYWTQHIRNTVHYHQTTNTLHQHHTTTYIETGPGHTLTTLTHHTLNQHTPTNPPPLLLTTLQPNQPETHTLHTTLATLHTHG
ncbi:acyltransferase domain-containing protein, partial [Streptomyces buecherae]|uniref:acyltransferase domain-containing protein n=1 Tax=Streptomyces buecherae TaxID=2763006 RepID=UPI00368CEE2C